MRYDDFFKTAVLGEYDDFKKRGLKRAAIIKDLCLLYRIGEATIKRWLAARNKTSNRTKECSPGQLDGDGYLLLWEWVRAHHDCTVEKLHSHLKCKGYLFSPSTLRRTLKKIGFIYKGRRWRKSDQICKLARTWATEDTGIEPIDICKKLEAHGFKMPVTLLLSWLEDSKTFFREGQWKFDSIDKYLAREMEKDFERDTLAHFEDEAYHIEED